DQLQLRGRLHWTKRPPDGNRRAIEYFDQAIAKDPSYGLAYAGLAGAHAVGGWLGFAPPTEAYARARAAATRALELDDSLVEAHVVLANVERDFDWDWAGAERSHRPAP